MMILFAMEMGAMIAYAIMGIGVVGMIWAAAASKKNESMKLFIYIFLAVVIGALLVKTFFINENDSQDARLYDNARIMQMARVNKVADYIVQKWPNGKVSFLVNEIQMQEQSEGDYLDKFAVTELKRILTEKGMECTDDLIMVGKLVKDDVYENPTDTAVLTKALKSQIDKVNVVVNFVGLPEAKGEADKLPYLIKKNTNNMNNMIVMSDVGLPYVNQKLFETARVVYVVSDTSEDLAFDFRMQKLPSDSQEVFDMFYAFLDTTGYATYRSKNSGLFPEE